MNSPRALRVFHRVAGFAFDFVAGLLEGATHCPTDTVADQFCRLVSANAMNAVNISPCHSSDWWLG